MASSSDAPLGHRRWCLQIFPIGRRHREPEAFPDSSATINSAMRLPIWGSWQRKRVSLDSIAWAFRRWAG